MVHIETLSISDILIPTIYSPKVQSRFSDVDLVISCGDLPYYYLEYIISMLDIPLYFVRGNHDSPVEYTVAGPRTMPLGAIDLHRRCVYEEGVLLAGVEGCLRYRIGDYQYSQAEMWQHVLRLAPSLLINRVRYGRFLDIFVSHAPPWTIHDRGDLPHRGIKAFLWLLKVFKPAYHFHGHIHIYHPEATTETRFMKTQVVNAYGFRHATIDIPAAQPIDRKRGRRAA